jgi:hypothetical protein
MFFAKFIILIGLIKLLNVTDSIPTCAVSYAVLNFIITIFLTGNPVRAVQSALIGGALSYLYCWLLKKTDGSFLWWIIVIIGMAIALI